MINARDKYHDTPLKNAYTYGNTATILKCIGYYSTKIDSTFLYHVCEQGSLDMIEVLLLDFNMGPCLVIDDDGNTPHRSSLWSQRDSFTTFE